MGSSDRSWRKPLRKTLYGRAAAAAPPESFLEGTGIDLSTDPSTGVTTISAPEAGELHVIVEGSSGSAGQTSLTMNHGGIDASTTALGIPIPFAVTSEGPVMASWLSSSVPAGSWTAYLQVRPAGSEGFSTFATFTIGTS